MLQASLVLRMTEEEPAKRPSATAILAELKLESVEGETGLTILLWLAFDRSL